VTTKRNAQHMLMVVFSSYQDQKILQAYRYQ